jgi:uncharacterized protein YbbK (DUF523 family)
MNQQTIPCPVCQTQITIDVHQLLHGMQFVCPQCFASIGLPRESREIVESAVEELDKLKQRTRVTG